MADIPSAIKNLVSSSDIKELEQQLKDIAKGINADTAEKYGQKILAVLEQRALGEYSAEQTERLIDKYKTALLYAYQGELLAAERKAIKTFFTFLRNIFLKILEAALAN